MANSRKQTTGRMYWGLERCVLARTLYFGTDGVTTSAQSCCCAQGCGNIPLAPPWQPCGAAVFVPSSSWSTGHLSAAPATACPDTLLAKCLGSKCALFACRDLQNLPTVCPSTVPFLCALWTLPSAENVCLGADTVLSSCLGAFSIRPILKHHILLSSPFFDYISLLMTVSSSFLSTNTKYSKVKSP